MAAPTAARTKAATNIIPDPPLSAVDQSAKLMNKELSYGHCSSMYSYNVSLYLVHNEPFEFGFIPFLARS